MEGAGSELENSDLEGGGIVYEADPLKVSNTDLVPVKKINPTARSTLVMEREEPLIVPSEKSSEEELVVKKVKKPEGKVGKKSGGKEGKKKNSISNFKHPKGAPWYFIGLND